MIIMAANLNHLICILVLLALISSAPARAQSEDEIFTKFARVAKGKFRSSISAFNNYLVKYFPQDKGVEEDIRQLEILYGAIKRRLPNTKSILARPSKSQDPLHRVAHELGILVGLKSRQRNELGFCTQNGQNQVQSLFTLTSRHTKDVRHKTNKEPDEIVDESRLWRIFNHFDTFRQQVCIEHFASVANKFHQRIQDSATLAENALIPLTNALIQLVPDDDGNLDAGYKAATCAHLIQRIDFVLDQQRRQLASDLSPGHLILEGIKRNGDQAQAELSSLGSQAEKQNGCSRETLKKFVVIRNKYITKPCQVYAKQFEEFSQQLRLYLSMYRDEHKHIDQQVADIVAENFGKISMYEIWSVASVCSYALQTPMSLMYLDMLKQIPGIQLDRCQMDAKELKSILSDLSS